jgi:hypothetical protein
MEPKCDLCGDRLNPAHAVSARLRHHETCEWVVIVRMCQGCARRCYGWRDEPVPKFAQPLLTTAEQFSRWLQLTPS